MINGRLEKACKKKNNLYNCFFKLRTKEPECKYENTKINLLLFSDLVRKCITTNCWRENNNIKGTCKVLNEIIIIKKHSSYPNLYIKNDVTITKKYIHFEWIQYFLYTSDKMYWFIKLIN